MTGGQHAAIGIGLALPVATGLATGLLPDVAPATSGLMNVSEPAAATLAAALTLGGGLLGALLPDLDAEHSTLEAAPRRVLRGLRRRRWWLVLLVLLAPLALLGLLLQLANWLLMLLTDHRGVTHSLTALGLTTAAAWLGTTWLIGSGLTFGLATGYASHLAADALTPRGVELAAPWSRRRWFLAPRRLRFGADSWRAGCLTGLVLLAGLLASGWQVWSVAGG